MKINYSRRKCFFFLASVFAGGFSLLCNLHSASALMSHKDSSEFKQFLKRVDEYVRLHKSVEGTLPALKPTDVPELITAHQQALARKIREARPNAKPGDIFTEDTAEAFRKAVHHELHGLEGRHERKTIRQGEPLKIHLEINQPYPDGVPYTTLPPTLLSKFPRLPAEVAYRIVGHDLILLDVKAGLVVDLDRDLIPAELVSP